MKGNEREFDRLVKDAVKAHFSGWDFSYLTGRVVYTERPWDYGKEVIRKMKGIESMLDLGTGGGEFLASLKNLPKRTVATEAYPPNVPLARRRLKPLGVEVVKVDSERGLPFESETFDLVMDRHTDYEPSQVWRVLRWGGTFVTQQVGRENNIQINEVLDERKYERVDTGLKMAVKELRAQGFVIKQQRDARLPSKFLDVGALVYYLKAVPWQFDNFSVERYRKQLLRVHELIGEKGSFDTVETRYFIEANKRSAS
jgi:SAM-dependent methyltransferase